MTMTKDQINEVAACGEDLRLVLVKHDLPMIVVIGILSIILHEYVVLHSRTDFSFVD
jgi:hypothetical protein